MANARVLDRRRKSVRNIRKITRTMELIATARFKKAMDRAVAATAYTERITQLVSDLAESGMELRHPLLEPRETVNNATLLVLTANRGLCGGYNGGVLRKAFPHYVELQQQAQVRMEISGNRGISALKYRNITADQTYTQFDDEPKFEEVEPIANGYLELFSRGEMDRLDVVYTRFVSSSKQVAVVETLLPLGSLGDEQSEDEKENSPSSNYEFVPSAESILEEVVPASFRVKLFKCFLDAAVSEQIARMVAMKSATENASEMIKQLSMSYNRARQSQITNEIMEIIGGVEALSG
jgi:F-type H+-transporting ATPase subunit gamma